ncbi:LysM peptidoglycan-binding domain-containing protein [Marinobacterium sp. AK62]|uniref:LysM peptidoglycan-binding domain-containing protein n=1 Tax=Marinobacterium alkalitolerans TaxID=1542925 RepID=A0ABS3ZC76_9GAMM|nr:LysM peptidoglycan-binding domain-containing protein [Marinobacterium alkalitolerans]MBP0048629.1 LysM peptidoglycan-binding domain-containing protein [Marinobacterium alkalitolerans]
MRSFSGLLLVTAMGITLAGCQTGNVKTAATTAQPSASPSKVASTTSRQQQQAEESSSSLPPADLWTLTRQHMALPLDLDHPRVQTQLKWYKRHPSYLLRVSERALPYYHHIINAVLDRGMPAEIALLPVVESAYDPFAYSHGRASGPWQFIPGTARHFGLRSSWWYDGRRDILASTDAALTYLEQLHQRFDGDWLLALAAYNAGGGTVSRAIRRNREQGKPTDFWSLDLPRETEAYVPKLLAVSRLVRDADQLGLELTPIPNKPYFARVKTGGQIDLAEVASLARMDLDELYRLNPGFNRWATDPKGPHELLVPVHKAETLQASLDAMPADQRVSWHRYTVKPGDTLSTIAQRFGSSTGVIREGNRLKSNLIRVGQALLVPQPAKPAEAYALTASQRKQAKRQRLEESSTNKRYHQVASGESFWSIARRYGVSVRSLARWNQMAPGDTLRAGQSLLVLGANAPVTPAVSLPKAQSRQAMVRKVGYRIRKGDSLSVIASRFGVKVSEILEWNSLSADDLLRPGQPLTLYVDIAEAG